MTQAAIGDTLFRMKRYEEAVEALRKALELAPEMPAAGALHELSGHSMLALGRREEALAAFDRALAVNPDLTGAEAGRQRALQQPGRGAPAP